MPARRARRLRRRLSTLDPTLQGLLWSMAAGAMFVTLNTIVRALAIGLDAYIAQFLRYLCGLIVLLPFVLRRGPGSFMPQSIAGQFIRGVLHTLGLYLWFLALPHISIADTTAIGFTSPIFIMLGAALFLHERMRWDRWVAAGVGLAGVLVVVAPRLSFSGGFYLLVMLSSGPVFAASFIVTKKLTRYERPMTIVLWQAVTVTLLSAPVALWHWQSPSALQWAGFLVSGVLGSAGHYCLTRSFTVADISATQSMKFLELIWAALLGYMVFADVPSTTTLLGGVVISASTLWIARREARRSALQKAAGSAGT